MTLKKIAGAVLLVISSMSVQAQVDLGGLWFPAGGPGQEPRETPFNDATQKIYDDYVASFTTEDDPGSFCVAPGLPRSIWGAPFPVEIQQNEAFITMFWEGYFQYRKIYMEGHPRPDPILPSGMGYSVGHWEGETLVVETTYLRAYPYMRRLPNSEEAMVTERISIVEIPDAQGTPVKTLVNELTLTDPRLYSQPVKVTGHLRWSPDTPIMEYSCSDTLYEMHLQEKGLLLPDFNQ